MGISRAIWHPTRVVPLAFLAAIIVGTVLLTLPIARAGPGGAPLMVALFTATSAVCVTGLTVVDTGTYWRGFGELIILLLFQLGGLGIMTFYTLALKALGRRLGLKHELAVSEAALVNGQSGLYPALSNVLALTVAAELAGAAALLACFRQEGLGWPEAACFSSSGAGSQYAGAAISRNSRTRASTRSSPSDCA